MKFKYLMEDPICFNSDLEIYCYPMGYRSLYAAIKTSILYSNVWTITHFLKDFNI